MTFLNKIFFRKKLIPYQVGENDIVAAYNPEQAIEILTEYVGCEFTEILDDDDVTKKQLDMLVFDEEGKNTGTLADVMKDVTKAEYLFGWE